METKRKNRETGQKGNSEEIQLLALDREGKMGKESLKNRSKQTNTVINISREIKDTASVKHECYVIFLKHHLESI